MLKQVFRIILLFSFYCAMAQVPQKMSFQALIKDNANNPVIASTVGIKISILQGSISGPPVYIETQNTATNSNGLISLVIGNGNVLAGNIASINWSSGNYYLKTETDPTGGTNYTVAGSSQLLSVPYALHAQTAGTFNETDPKVGSTLISNFIPKWDGVFSTMKNSRIYDNGSVGIGTNSPISLLSVGAGYFNNVNAIMSVNTTSQKPLILGDTANQKGIILGYDGNIIQGRSGVQFSNNTDLLLNPFAGNVGIGTNQPFAKLDVEGDVNASELKVFGGIVVDADNQNNSDGVNILKFGSLNSGEGIGSSRTVTNNNHGLDFYTDYTPRLSIANWGGVGIGTIFPGNSLDINGNLSVGNGFTENFPAPLNGAIIEGDVGIGKVNPTSKLDVNGKTTTTNIRITNGANAGFVLQSDLSGNGAWVNPSTLSITETDPQVASTSANRIPKWNGTALVDGLLIDNGTNIGIGTSTPTEKLDVSGKTKTTNLQMTSGATAGYVLQSDATGNGAWVNPATLSLAETDPQVASTTVNKIPKWNGTTLVDGQIFDNGTNIGVGTASPTDKMHVVGNIKIEGGRIPFINNSASIYLGDNTGNSDNLGTVTSNVAIGNNALAANTTGFGNVSLGHDSMRFATGGGNTALGYGSLKSATGSNNVAVGKNGLLNNSLGDSNVGVGESVMFFNTSGNQNVAVGRLAGMNNISGSRNVFLGYGAGYNETGSDKLYVDNSPTNNPLIYGNFATDVVAINGNMGIGTTTPTQAKLVIEGGQNNTIGSPNGYGYLSRTTVNNVSNSTTADYSIYASNRIAASEFNAFSDARIKNIKGMSNNKEDLETLSKIEITNYTLKDSVAKGNKNYKKVIAQQVAKVYPQAVSQITDVIPDVYRQADMTNGYIALENNLKAGEVVKIIFAEEEKILTVQAASANGFTVDSSQSGKVFVYGRQVTDFHTVDYEALTTLNISATQELLQRIEQLEKENTVLKSEISTIEEIKNQLKAELKTELLYEVNRMQQSVTSEPLLLTKN